MLVNFPACTVLSRKVALLDTGPEHSRKMQKNPIFFRLRDFSSSDKNLLIKCSHSN